MKLDLKPWLLATVVALNGPPVQAQSAASELSAISALPVVVSATASVAVPASLLVAGSTLVVVSVEVVAGATVWVLERASDGARLSLKLTGKALEGSAIVAGTAVMVSVIGAGTVLSVAGEAICFIPNEIGKALLHNEKVSR